MAGSGKRNNGMEVDGGLPRSGKVRCCHIMVDITPFLWGDFYGSIFLEFILKVKIDWTLVMYKFIVCLIINSHCK